MDALVLLSGGMDSCVALFEVAARNDYYPYRDISALFINYGQVAADAEFAAARAVWDAQKSHFNIPGTLDLLILPRTIFAGQPSILGRTKIDEYETPDAAVQGTPHDRSEIPFRNGIFLALAAHHFAIKLGKLGAGDIITGIRGRPVMEGAPGFADCSSAFITKMGDAIFEGVAASIGVLNLLNELAPTREKTLRIAQDLPGCWSALGQTVTCFAGKPPCGKCLPCQRRAQAFAALGRPDPALEA